ncbi:MAG TPA: hypothetical protein VLL52_18700 [Anaerolineae bacterium]|nr:hypothetical protein [Anaerolineae bacterium]
MSMPTAISTIPTTLTSTLINQTATPPLLPTVTPYPTISIDEAGQLYQSLYENNNDCLLPCWWNFEVGKTSLEEVEQFYTMMGAYLYHRGMRDEIILEALFVNAHIEDGIQTRHIYRTQNNIIQEIEAQIGRKDNYQLKPLLQTLGQPADVWLWTIPNSWQDLHPARLLVYFPEKGVLLSYSILAERKNENIHLCFNQSGDANILLWSPDKSYETIEERAQSSSELTIEENMRPIEEISSWHVAKFYETIINNQSDCLQTPAELWPTPF